MLQSRRAPGNRGAATSSPSTPCRRWTIPSSFPPAASWRLNGAAN